MKNLMQHLERGWSFIRSHPQIIYTILLLICIPTAYIISAQWFLTVANENQERIERESIGLLQSTIVHVVGRELDDLSSVSRELAALRQYSESIALMRLVRLSSDGTYEIVASSDTNEIGTIDTGNLLGYREVALEPSRSLIFETPAADGRHWVAFRTVPVETGERPHVLLLDLSLARIDAVAAQNIVIAYLVLGLLVLIMLALVLRQARIVDYATLYRQLQEVDKLKDDFISLAAHELRAPLTAIRGHAEMLEPFIDKAHAGRQSLERIETSAEQLSLLIDDILDVARLQTGKMAFTFEPVRLSEVVADVFTQFEGVAREKLLTLGLENNSESYVLVDRTRMRQVLINLIGNAIKYTPSGTVTVQFNVIGAEQQIAVLDTGLGISAEDQEQLFKKFFRVRSAETASIRGTGLGLWITKAIIEKHKGTLQVESMKGVGSKFIVSLPTVKGDPTPSGTPAS